MSYIATGGTQPQPDQPHQPRTVVRVEARANYMMSEIGDGVFVQWGTCTKCIKRVDACMCPTGPAEPAHIRRWREGRFDPEVAARMPRKGLVPAEALEAMRAGLLSAWDKGLADHVYHAGLAVLERYEADESGRAGKVLLVWDCPNEDCGRENIPESEAECPVCGTANPSVTTVADMPAEQSPDARQNVDDGLENAKAAVQAAQVSEEDDDDEPGTGSD